MKRVALLLATVVLGAATPPPPQSLYSLPGTWVAPQTYTRGTVASALRYDARAFGSCTWDNAHDVGPCINLAIAAATAAGGGEIDIPAGVYGVSTTISVGTTGIHLRGAGVGSVKDDRTTINATHLVWIGAAHGTILDIEPASNVSLYSDDVTGIMFDAASLADYAVKIEQVSNSVFYIGAADGQLGNIWLTTEPASFGDGPGNQNNDFWLWSRNSSGTYSPTGVLIDGGSTSSWNTSFNRFHMLWLWYAKGDGVVFGWGDNNLVEDLVTFPDGTTHGGTPAVFANTKYVAKNGLQVNGSSTDTRILKTESSGIVAGFQSGSTITPGANTGTAAVTTISLTTSAPTTTPNSVLNFASTTNVLPGMTANCGSWYAGVAPNTPVLLVASTTVTLASVTVNNVANGANCIFSYGITTQAVNGTYTMTAVDGTHWTLAAPGGGHNQTNIAVANNAISFTDMVIPLTGTPVTGDTFTIVVPYPAKNISLEGFDGAVEPGSADTNHIPLPMVEPGGMAFLASMLNPYPTMLGGNGNIGVTPLTGTSHNLVFGGFGNISNGAYSVVTGGLNNTASGFGSRAAGQTANASGIDDVAEGSSVTTTGRYSRAEGSLSTDRGRQGASCYASGDLTAQGDTQSCNTVLRGTGSSTSAVALTSDGTTNNSANCINMPNSTAYALGITITAIDHTSPGKNETWINWGGLMTRVSGTVALTMQSKPTPVTNGTVTGSDVSATADTVNGCLTLTFTPPSGNSDTWNAVARVTTIEVQ